MTDAAGRKHRSASQLETFLRCPEMFRLEKVEKAPGNPAAWLTQGVAFHDAIEKWEGTGRHYSADMAVSWFDAAWDALFAEQLEKQPDVSAWLTGGRSRPDHDIETRHNRGRQQVRDYIGWAQAGADFWRVLDLGENDYAVEVSFDITLGGVNVVGYIDQLIEWRTGLVTVRDLKTGNKLPPHPRQLGIYKIAAEEVLGLDIAWGDFYMSKNTDTTEPYDLTRFTRERVGRWFNNLDASITEGRFIPNPGDHCRICPVERFCDFRGSESSMFPVKERESA